jgi:hypothetical protein
MGKGHPLEGTSWRNRPLQAGWFVGGLFGDSLIDGRVSQGENLFGGYRVGWDFDHYWGTEARFGFGYLPVSDVASGDRLPWCRQDYGDVDLLYYPWGDSRWRPFLSVGVGWSFFHFEDDGGQTIGETLFSAPLGVGVKYLFRRWVALRLTATDNIAFGNGTLSTMHNWSLTGGAELRFGGPRISYFPYHADRHLWW